VTRLLTLLPGALISASVLSACGTVAATSARHFQGDQRAVAQAVNDLSSAASGHDGARICKTLLSAAVSARLNRRGDSCQSAVLAQLDATESFDLTVQSVSVSGDQASARVKGTQAGRQHVSTLILAREGGRWRLAALG